MLGIKRAEIGLLFSIFFSSLYFTKSTFISNTYHSMLGINEDASLTTKRFKDSNEAIKPVKRLKKTTYFPVNNLTNPQTNQSNIQKSPIRPIDINSITTKVNPVQEINRNNTDNLTKVQKQLELNFLQENSDDSFDGIRWKESPEIKGSHKQMEIKKLFWWVTFIAIKKH